MNSMELGTDWKSVQSARCEAFKRWNDLAKRFGMTPADRPRVKLNGKAADDKSDKARFFKSGPIAGKIGAA